MIDERDLPYFFRDNDEPYPFDGDFEDNDT
jgi:hypothetical protein